MAIKDTIEVYRLNQEDVKRILVDYYEGNSNTKDWELTIDDVNIKSNEFNIIISKRVSNSIE